MNNLWTGSLLFDRSICLLAYQRFLIGRTKKMHDQRLTCYILVTYMLYTVIYMLYGICILNEKLIQFDKFRFWLPSNQLGTIKANYLDWVTVIAPSLESDVVLTKNQFEVKWKKCWKDKPILRILENEIIQWVNRTFFNHWLCTISYNLSL